MQGIIRNIPLSSNGKTKNIDIQVINKTADYTKKQWQGNVLFVIIMMKISITIAD